MVNKMGFFAEAGPVQIFVSNHLIPDDMEFQYGDIPNYTTSDGLVKIQKDTEVRLKIIGTRVDATEIEEGVDIIANSLHPGLVVTNIARHYLGIFNGLFHKIGKLY
ncbi:hypothetical protein SLE2022_017940 [Rubroshorea leprosula]